MSDRIAATRRVARHTIGVLLWIAIASTAITACQTANGSQSPRPRVPRDTLLGSELARYPALSLYEALEAARPLWMLNRGKPLGVSVDDAPPTNIDMLRLIPATDVEEVRMLRSFSEARVRPTVLPGGQVVYRDLLVVLTRKR